MKWYMWVIAAGFGWWLYEKRQPTVAVSPTMAGNQAQTAAAASATPAPLSSLLARLGPSSGAVNLTSTGAETDSGSSDSMSTPVSGMTESIAAPVADPVLPVPVNEIRYPRNTSDLGRSTPKFVGGGGGASGHNHTQLLYGGDVTEGPGMS